MIELHHHGRDAERFFLNHELIVSVEAHPDTVVTLTTGVKLLVREQPDDIARQIQAWRADVLADALTATAR